MNALIYLVPLADKVPDPSDVKAGWVAFAVFVALCLAVAFLGFSLTKHLRRADESAERGAFDPSDPPRDQRGTPRNRPDGPRTA
jgi:hypothetical protein